MFVDNRLGQMISSSYLPPHLSDSLYAGVDYDDILVPLDQSPAAELALAQAQTMARNYVGTIQLLTVLDAEAPPGELGATAPPTSKASAMEYLTDVAADLQVGGYRSSIEVRAGSAAEEIGAVAKGGNVDLVVLSTQGRSRLRRWVLSHVTMDVIHQTTPPLLILRPTDDWRSTRTRFRRLLVALDGSATAEQVLPHVHEIASKFASEVTLLSAPEGSQSDDFVHKVAQYLDRIAQLLRKKGVNVKTKVVETAPVQAILSTSTEEGSDLIMLVSHGTGGVERQEQVRVGSVVESLLQDAPCPIFLVSALPELPK